ncbi:uncharacterized protein C20orf96-like [Babylonia areolata]|uniref:uncharacterized protein C20orf96-like n=1 Tax=Babylonia areolata TaxID=304850 RepID=UPI003FD1D7F1
MTSEGWGKRATTRIDRSQFGNDELLKSLGQQFNLDFANYDQWERKKPSRPPPPPKQKATEQPLSFLVSRPSKSADTVKKALSYREKKQAVKTQEEDKRRWERITILELRIQTRTKTLQQYKKRTKELLEENIKLKSEIDFSEGGTHDGVKQLLRRYEKYRGGIVQLNTNFTKEMSDAQVELEMTRQKVETELEVLEQQVAEVDAKLKAKQEELQVLNSYKDKEYPVKAMMITNLMKEIESVKNSNQEDSEELEHIINTELGKYDKQRIRITNDMTRDVTERAVAMMHPSLKDMALQNMVMKKEIEFHKKEQVSLRESNRVLENEVDQLLRDPKTNIRLQMFPEFFPSRMKCTPDMDVVLDIPTQQWLPI